MQKESLKNIKYLKRYKKFKTETKNRKQMEKQKRNFQNPFSPTKVLTFSPGWRHPPGLKPQPL